MGISNISNRLFGTGNKIKFTENQQFSIENTDNDILNLLQFGKNHPHTLKSAVCLFLPSHFLDYIHVANLT